MGGGSSPPRRIDAYAGPYERWAFTEALGKPFALPPELMEGSARFTALVESAPGPAELAAAGFRLPLIWQATGAAPSVLPAALETALPLQGDLAGSLSDALTAAPGAARYRLGFPIGQDSWTENFDPAAPAPGWEAPAKPPRAIVAVIDSGIPFAHRAFLGSDGRSRVSHVWLQSAPAEASAAVPFGREIANGRIDSLLTQAGGNEALCYRLAGIERPGPGGRADLSRRAATHGAHVTGLAAGNSSLFGDEMPDEVQIIAVQLPDAISWDTSGIGKDAYLLAALHYVMVRARDIAANLATPGQEIAELPLFINLSFGWTAGRHDGGSALEEAMAALVEERRKLQARTMLVLPTGNDFANRQHAVFEATDLRDGPCALGLRVQPDDKTCSYIELWFPQDAAPDAFQVTLTPPHGRTEGGGSLRVGSDPAFLDGDPRRFVDLTIGGEVIGQMSADLHRGTRWRALIALLPSLPLRGHARHTPPGLWQLEVQAMDGKALGPVDIWVQRDEDPVALGTGGRQAYLVPLSVEPRPDPLRIYDGRLDRVRGYGALNAIATGGSVMRIGGYQRLDGRPSAYSGSAALTPTADGAEIRGAAPHVSAVSDESRLRPGILSIGSYGGMLARFFGTSVAAPQVVRRMVLNTLAGRDVWDGFTDRPDSLANGEPLDAVSAAQHAARLGTRICPPVSSPR